MHETALPDMNRIGDAVWEIPRTGSMRVPGRIYADEEIASSVSGDRVLEQVTNVAHLPGIVDYSLALPDIHLGYGFPIGGVGAFTMEEGVISPGGVGYDINCGVRLIACDLVRDDIRDRLQDLADALFRDVPSGVGAHGAISRLSAKQLNRVLTQGAGWVVGNGYGEPRDLEHTEERGALEGANPDTVSERALTRGADQVGTLGSGNHFLELQVVDRIYDQEAAAAYDLEEGQIALMIHCGSRGFGYQICDDYLEVMAGATRRYHIDLPDRQLACAPVDSPEGKRYLEAMACAANYAWANRQMIQHLATQTILRVLSLAPRTARLRLVYDVAHNIAKIEDHATAAGGRRLCVHRKGATRAFGPEREEVPDAYRRVGQPVLVPGDMGSASFLCRGTEKAMQETFGSTCHGAGRVLSRRGALKKAKGRSIAGEMAQAGIVVRSRGKHTLQEEMPDAYKKVDQVVDVMDRSGISPRVARLRPLVVVKG